jgi:hypothetical protein
MEVAGPEAQPNGDSYNFVIALCALKHIQAMYKRGLVPSAATYNEVLLACARSRQTQTAVTVLKELKVVLEPETHVAAFGSFVFIRCTF